MPKLVGLPDIRGYLVTLSLECACEGKHTLLIAATPGVVFGCVACRQMWQVDGFVLDTRRNVVEVDISKVAAMPQKVAS